MQILPSDALQALATNTAGGVSMLTWLPIADMPEDGTGVILRFAGGEMAYGCYDAYYAAPDGDGYKRYASAFPYVDVVSGEPLTNYFHEGPTHFAYIEWSEPNADDRTSDAGAATD